MPHRRWRDLETQYNIGIESIMIKVIIHIEKWLFIGMYEPPHVASDDIINSLVNTVNT